MARRHIQAIAAVVAGISGLCDTVSTARADGYQRAPVVSSAFSWSGLYIGANGGYAWSNDQTVQMTETREFATVAPNVFFRGNFGSLAEAGGFGGVQAGANLQIGGIVLGFEADGQWADITDDLSATATFLSYTVRTSNKVRRFGTFRPRLGLAWDRTLLYGTAGLAWGRVEHIMTFRDALGFNSLDHVTGTQVGYVIGGGIEHAFSTRVSLKLEYQYVDLGSEHYTAAEYNATGAATGFRTNIDASTEFHTVRLGLNYKLGGDR